MSGLVSVGAAVLRVIGLSPQRIGASSEARVPGRATFGGMDYQLTGMGDRRVRLEFATWPQVLGGLDALAILRQLHESQTVTPFQRLGAHYLATLTGMVVIQTLDVDEERLHPITGTGRVVTGEADLLLVGDAGGTTIGTGLSAALGGWA